MREEINAITILLDLAETSYMSQRKKDAGFYDTHNIKLAADFAAKEAKDITDNVQLLLMGYSGNKQHLEKELASLIEKRIAEITRKIIG